MGHDMRSPLALAIGVLLVLGPVAAASGGAVATTSTGSETPGTAPVGSAAPASGSGPSAGDDACGPLSNGSARPDPTGDRLGWESGCWHDASLAVDPADGLNGTELDAVVARAMARVEVVRRLEFGTAVPIEVVSRTTYADRVAERLGNVSETERLRVNVKWEALLMVDESTDAVDVRQSNAAGASGYYSPQRQRIVVVSGSPATPKVDELLLAHELVHPLQVQHFDVAERFDLSTFEQRRTTDSLNAIEGLLEGDAELVRRRYRNRCGDEWDCLRASERGDVPEIHDGMALLNNHPYNDGPSFVNALYMEGGWERVDAAYRTPPASAEQVVHPGRYPEETPANVTLTDRSGGEWHRLAAADERPDHLSLGEPGITAMLFYPFFSQRGEGRLVVPARIFVNRTPGGASEFDPFRYGNNPYAEGWEGDRLHPYVTDESPETGETGYVWKTVWETGNDSREFVDGYTRLLRYYGATPVEGRPNTYRIPEGEPFADAYYVERAGNAVYVVNAPTVGDLSKVWAGAGTAAGLIVPGVGVLGVPAAAGLLALAALAGGAVALARRRR